MILLKFHVPSRDLIFSFKVSQNLIVYESAEDRNLRAIFNRVKNALSFYQIVMQLECLSYLPKMNLFPWIAFLPKGFENGIIQKVLDRRLHMAWGSISLFGGFLENENSLETLNVIFENVPPKGSF